MPGNTDIEAILYQFNTLGCPYRFNHRAIGLLFSHLHELMPQRMATLVAATLRDVINLFILQFSDGKTLLNNRTHRTSLRGSQKCTNIGSLKRMLPENTSVVVGCRWLWHVEWLLRTKTCEITAPPVTWQIIDLWRHALINLAYGLLANWLTVAN